MDHCKEKLLFHPSSLKNVNRTCYRFIILCSLHDMYQTITSISANRQTLPNQSDIEMMISSGSFYYKLLQSADQEMHNVKGVSIYEIENEPISKVGLIAYKLGEIFAKCPHMKGPMLFDKGWGCTRCRICVGAHGHHF